MNTDFVKGDNHHEALSTAIAARGSAVRDRRGDGGVLRRNVLVWIVLGLATAVMVGHPSDLSAAQNADEAKPVLVARSCASECQSQHDRCRVETKGSRTCDEVRQHCLQLCLQKKRK